LKQKNIGIFSFFSGAGFLDLGFEHVQQYEILFVNEAHKPFMDIYQGTRALMQHKEPKYGYHLKDIARFIHSEEDQRFLALSVHEAKAIKDIVGFIGGPPCPDFSIAGKNKGHRGDNGKLSETYIDLIIKNMPDFFLFENVKGLYRTKKHREFFDYMKKKLTVSGYALTEKLINSIEYGVPQDRERIILVGFQKNYLEDNRIDILNFDWNHNVKYSAEEIFAMNWPTKSPFAENSATTMPNGIIKELTVQYWFDKNDVQNHPNSNKHFKPKAGLSKFQTIDEGDDKKKSYKRLHRWRYSPTAAYGNNEVHLHPYKARRLTAAEAMAIQSLPKNFILPNEITLTNMFKTIGNGVPYLASKGIAEAIDNFITGEDNEKIYSG